MKISTPALILVSSLFLLASCKKDNSTGNNNTPTNTISAKVNGASFQGNASASLNTVTSLGNLVITGARVSNSANLVETITILLYIQSGVSVATGDYTFSAEDCSNQSFQICGLLGFSKLENGNTTVYWSDGSTDGFNLNISDIDYKTGGYVKGSFSGNLSDGNGNFVTVTEGKFNANIQ